MRQSREWFWEIEQAGQGPDYIFTARFAAGEAEHLAGVVRAHLPPNFAPTPDFFDAQRRAAHTLYTHYLDQHTYDRLVAQQASASRENIWYYGEIEVCDHELTVRNILAGGRYGETGFILAVIQSAGLTVQAWQVAYGGDMGGGEIAQGSDAASLVAYLQAD